MPKPRAIPVLPIPQSLQTAQAPPSTSPSTTNGVTGTWYVSYASGQFCLTYVFSHITFSSCSCDSYFSRFIVVWFIKNLGIKKSPTARSRAVRPIGYFAVLQDAEQVPAPAVLGMLDIKKSPTARSRAVRPIGYFAVLQDAEHTRPCGSRLCLCLCRQVRLRISSPIAMDACVCYISLLPYF